MALRTILCYPDPRLHKVAQPVQAVDARVHTLIDDMIETMYEAGGIGLAATQIDVHERVVVIDTSEERNQPMVLINPEITWASEDRSVYEEGCLSIPEQYADVERPAEVRVRWTTLEGTVAEEAFAGLWATCVQHEIDHLNGRLFIDYLKPLRRQMITRRMEKLKRERARA